MITSKTWLAAVMACLTILPSLARAGNVGGTPARHAGVQPMPAPAPAAPTATLPAPVTPQPADSSPSTPSTQGAPSRSRATSSYATGARQSLEDAIEHEKSRRTWAISGVVIGGVVIIGGLVYSAVDAQRRANRSGKDQYAVNWIGLGVGAPIVAISIYNLVGAQKKLNRLQLQRAQVGVAPRAGGAEVELAISF